MPNADKVNVGDFRRITCYISKAVQRAYILLKPMVNGDVADDL